MLTKTQMRDQSCNLATYLCRDANLDPDDALLVMAQTISVILLMVATENNRDPLESADIIGQFITELVKTTANWTKGD